MRRAAPRSTGAPGGSPPQPLTRAETRRLLRAEEALVAILVGSDKSFVWAVTREGADWAQLDIGADALAREVTTLRLGLDPLAQQTAEGTPGAQAGIVASFDVPRAHALYQKLLGPVATLLAGKQHMLVVPAGALSSLPFQVLLPRRASGLAKDSKAQAEQVRAVAVDRIGALVALLPPHLVAEVDDALRLHLSL